MTFDINHLHKCGLHTTPLPFTPNHTLHTLHTKTHPSHQNTPFTPNHTLHTKPHPSHQTTPFTPNHTLHTKPHPSHQTTPFTPNHTLHTKPHPSHQNTPFTPNHTLHTKPHPSHQTTPFTPNHTLHTKPHPSHQPYLVMFRLIGKASHLIQALSSSPSLAASPVVNTLTRTESGGNLSESTAASTKQHLADVHDYQCSNHQERANGHTRNVAPGTIVAQPLPSDVSYLATNGESNGGLSCTTESAPDHVRFGGSVEIPSSITTEASRGQRGPTPPGAGPRGPTPPTVAPPVAPKPRQVAASVSVSAGGLCCGLNQNGCFMIFFSPK